MRAKLLRAPLAVCADAEKVLFGAELLVVRHDSGLVVVEATFRPTLELVANGFTSERVRIAQLSDTRHPVPYSFPVGPARRWHHRYGVSPEHGNFGQLCMWYPEDPAELQWSWALGFARFVALTQKHLWYEEYFRRTGEWLAEDAPHGRRHDGNPHPILDPALRMFANVAA